MLSTRNNKNSIEFEQKKFASLENCRLVEIKPKVAFPLGDIFREERIFLLSLVLSTRTNQNSFEFGEKKFVSLENFRLVEIQPKEGRPIDQNVYWILSP